MTEPPRGPLWSAQLAPTPPTPVAALGAIERAAAAQPTDRTLWHAALVALLRGRVGDDDIGAAAAMGTARPLAVAVVTPYHREDLAVLRRCHESVLAQTYPCRHVMVADGDPRPEIDGWGVEHVKLERGHADFGDTPRAAGGERALAAGCGAIAYLDADNTFRRHHVESLVHRWQATGAPVVFSGRTMHFPDGRLVPAIDPEDGRSHIDTNCLFIAGEALAMASAWVAYPRPLSIIGDRMVVRMLQARGLVLECTGALTARYTAHYAHLYEGMRLPVPADAREILDFGPAADYYRGLSADTRRALDAQLGFPLGAFLREFVRRYGIELD
jgi:hypothetical protein